MPQLPTEIWRRRLESEFEEMQASDYSFVVTKDLREYVVALEAKALAEEGGVVKPRESHRIKVALKRDFPYPGGVEVVFLTQVFHPNIRSQDGKVCIQLLKNWGETTSVLNLVEGVKWLLSNPNAKDPLNPVAADYFLKLEQSSEGREAGEAEQGIRKPRVLSTQ